MVKKDDSTEPGDKAAETVKPEIVRHEKTTEHVKEEAKADAPAEAVVTRRSPPWPVITIGIFGIILVLAALSMAWLHVASRMQTTQRIGSQYGAMDRQQYGGGREWSGRGQGGMRGGYGRPAVTGVITAVNGNTLTVSGSGKQVTVKKTDSTKVSGDESDVAVNDTVIVYGQTADDGSVTATRITVRNSGLLEGATTDDPSDAQSDAATLPSA